MKLLPVIFFMVSFFANAKDYYVATNGIDTNDGLTIQTPFKTFTKAYSMVVAGDRILLRSGTYAYGSTITLSKSGTAALPIKFEGYNGERPLFDFSTTASGKRGFTLSGSYWLIKGIDVCKAGDNGMSISGAYNTIDFCSFYDNEDSGLQLSGKAHDNKILNCDSYWNADPPDFADADGFAVKMDVGSNNYFYGCRAWLNCDDGWDGYLRGADDVTTVVDNCWTWKNGYLKDGVTDPGSQANGNGFKMGGSDDKLLKHNFTVKNCLAFDNKAKGFDQNNNKGTMVVYNGTSFRNKGNNYSFPSALATGKTCTITNCVNFTGNISIGNFVSQKTNSWLANTVFTSSDFVSIDTTGVSGPRGSDGSLPNINFMRLSATSKLINIGTDVGLPFAGSAPDLGAFEYGSTLGLSDKPVQKEFKAIFSGGILSVKIEDQFNDLATLSLYNLNGQMLLKSSFYSNDTEIDCSLLQNGFYILELSYGLKHFVSKIIK